LRWSEEEEKTPALAQRARGPGGDWRGAGDSGEPALLCFTLEIGLMLPAQHAECLVHCSS